MSSASSSRKKQVSELIRLAGVTPFTTIDFPGELAAVLFLQGCPWRCDYCHNKEIIDPKKPAKVSWQAALDFLAQRRNLIDAVVFSGGEPTLQSRLPEAIRQVRELNFKIGLHTAGTYPERLKRILPLVDWVGLDIKASAIQYADITGVANSAKDAWQSAKLVIEAEADYEIRTTLHPKLTDRSSLYKLVDELQQINVLNYAIQECNLDFCSELDIANAEIFRLNQTDLDKMADIFPKFEFRTLS